MKKQILTILATLSCYLFAMEIPLQNFPTQMPEPIIVTQENIEKITHTIDTAINQEYSQLFGFIFSRITDESARNILNIPTQCYPSIVISTLLIESLKDRNKNFNSALEHMLKIAQSNFENVTVDTLHLVENVLYGQPMRQLNNLCQSMKSYLMQTAQKNIQSSYDIVAHCESIIKLCDVCCIKDWAATYHKDKTINIWNLNTGTILYTIKDIPKVTALVFNPLNSQLFIAQSNKKTTPTIKIWDVETKQSVADFSFNYPEVIIEDISFAPIQDTSFMIAMFLRKEPYEQSHCMSQWIISGKNYSHSVNINAIKRYITRYNQKGDYLTTNPKYEPVGKMLSIERKDRFAYYLCKQAAKSITDQKDSTKIPSSCSYRLLNEYERKLIADQMNKR